MTRAPAMRIVHISSSDLQGGAARAAYRLHCGLLRAGEQSTMLVKDKVSDNEAVFPVALDRSSKACRDMDESRWMQKYAIDAHRTDISTTYFSLPVPGYDVTNQPVVAEADVVNVHWVSGLLSPISIARLQAAKGRIFWTLHDQRAFTGGCHFSSGCSGYARDCSACPQLEPEAGGCGVAAGILRESVDAIDPAKLVVICPSRWLAECARRSRLFRDCRVEVIPYAIDTQFFKPWPRAQARAALGMNSAAVYFLFGADNFSEKRKGFRGLSDSIRICMQDREFCQAIQSGRMQWRCFGEAGRYLDDFPVPVKCLGRIVDQHQLGRVYAAADVFVLPSIEDNLPNTMLESMCCGTPVIGFEAGGVPDAVVPAETGLLAPNGDCGAFAVAILRLWREASLREKLSRSCAELAPARFSMEVQAGHYLKLYREDTGQAVVGKGTLGTEAPWADSGPAFGALVPSLLREAKRQSRAALWDKLLCKKFFSKKR